MYFQALADAGTGDVVQPDDDFPWSSPRPAWIELQGASLDFVTDAFG